MCSFIANAPLTSLLKMLSDPILNNHTINNSMKLNKFLQWEFPAAFHLYAPNQYQFGSDVTSASFAFNWSRGREAALTRAARRYACCVYTEQALILSDVTTKLLVTWIIVLKFWVCTIWRMQILTIWKILTIWWIRQFWGWYSTENC